MRIPVLKTISILSLTNKLALVTGASGSIGSAVAQRLAQDGASVLVHLRIQP